MVTAKLGKSYNVRQFLQLINVVAITWEVLLVTAQWHSYEHWFCLLQRLLVKSSVKPCMKRISIFNISFCQWAILHEVQHLTVILQQNTPKQRDMKIAYLTLASSSKHSRPLITLITYGIEVRLKWHLSHVAPDGNGVRWNHGFKVTLNTFDIKHSNADRGDLPRFDLQDALMDKRLDTRFYTLI